MNRHQPAQRVRSLAAIIALSVAGAACAATDDAASATTAAPAIVATTAPATAETTETTAPVADVTTTAPSTTAPSLATTTAPEPRSVPGRDTAFEMTDGEFAFSITTDETTGTVRVLLQPSDGSAAPRWEAVAPWVDEPNSSGHRPFDALPAALVSSGASTDENLQLVQDYVQTSLVEGRWEDVDRFFRDGAYVLHGPFFDDGLESVRSFFIGLRDAGAPFTITSTSAWLAAGDFVLAINRQEAGGIVTAYWDLWRIDDGAIAEHWDAIMPIPTDVADAWFAGTGPAV